MNNVAVSVDAFHQEYIPLRIVEQNVRALIDAGIDVWWNPCWVISKEHKNSWNDRTGAVLHSLHHFGIR